METKIVHHEVKDTGYWVTREDAGCAQLYKGFALSLVSFTNG